MFKVMTNSNSHKSSVIGLSLLLIAFIVIIISWYVFNHNTNLNKLNVRNTDISSQLKAINPELRIVGLKQAIFHPSNSCNVSYINSRDFNQTVRISKGSVIGIGGWLVDKINKNVPKKSWLIVVHMNSKTSYQIPIEYWTDRPDVREALGGNPGYTQSGFIVVFNTTMLTKGDYHLYLVYRENNIYYTCDNGRHIVLN